MNRAALACASLVMCLCSIAGCNELASWRDSQIKTSHAIGQGTQISIPDPPLQIPDKLYGELPLETGFTILSYNDNRQYKEVSVVALMDKDLNDGSMWLLTIMTKLGYQSGDNASRILEGVTYGPIGRSAKYSSIHVKIEYGTANQAILHIKAKQD